MFWADGFSFVVLLKVCPKLGKFEWLALGRQA